MTDILNVFPDPQDLDSYFSNLLSISGALFGLAFAAITFVLQNIISSFTASRKMLLKTFIIIGKNMLFSLAFIIIQTLLHLYINSILITNISFLLFYLILLKYFLDHYNQAGYQETLFSTKFTPKSFGKIRRYFRYIKNLGVLVNIRIFFEILILFVFPIFISFIESGKFLLTSNVLFYSTIIFLLRTILSIVLFFNYFYEFTKISIDKKIDEKSPDIDYSKEKKLLKKYLKKSGVSEIEDGSEKRFLDGTLQLILIEDKQSNVAFFNIMINLSSNDLKEIKVAVFKYSHNLILKLYQSQVDLNTFILSFHIQSNGINGNPRNIFIRISKLEIEKLLKENIDFNEFIEGIKNLVLDDLFRDLQ